jgi:hypothetical protein
MKKRSNRPAPPRPSKLRPISERSRRLTNWRPFYRQQWLKSGRFKGADRGRLV